MLGYYAVLVLIGLCLTLADSGYYEFTKNTCHFTYGESLGQVEMVNSMQCVKACTQHVNCTSLMYETATRQCFLNAKTQEDEDLFPPDCGVKYAAPVVKYFGCDEGWQYLAGRCYLYVDQRLTWYGCDDFCIGENSYLAKLYNLSTYAILYNVTQTGWQTAVVSSAYPWMTINDLSEENVYTDRDDVPINPELIPTMSGNGDTYDCGYVRSADVRMSFCDNAWSCICEKQARIITKRPNPFI